MGLGGRALIAEGGGPHRVYLIDGYNVVHELRNQGMDTDVPMDADGQAFFRQRLIDGVASLVGGAGDRAIIVFDSKVSQLQDQVDAIADVDVIFGSFKESADSIIERLAYGLSAGENVVVVTSDYGLQKTVYRTNIQRRSAREFVLSLQNNTTKVANRSDCIRMGHRVEDGLSEETLARLKEVRDRRDRKES